MGKRFLILSIVLAIFLSLNVFAIRYYDSGSYGSASLTNFLNIGNLNILDFYSQYGSYIDMIIFLMIFLGVAKSVFSKHFQEGGKTIYVGIGIFLSLALLLFEERQGFRLLTEFGPFVVFLIIALFLYGLAVALYRSGKGGIFAVAAGYLVLYFFVFNWYRDYFENLYGFWNIIKSIANIGAIIAILIVAFGIVVGIWNMATGKNKTS